MTAMPIWIAGRGGTPMGGATAVSIVAYGGPGDPSLAATEAQVVGHGHGGAPPSGVTAAWVLGYGAPPIAGTTAIWISGVGVQSDTGTAVGPGMWNPADLANMTLSNGNLACAQTATGASVRSTTSQSAGKYHVEFTLNAGDPTTFYMGFANANWPLTTWLGSDVNSIGGNSHGTIVALYMNGGIWDSYTVPNIFAAGDTIAMEFDCGAGMIWVQNVTSGPANWNGSSTANPATGTGGLTLAGGATGGGPWFVAFNFNAAGSGQATANFGGSPFALTPSSGFSAWG
jgi:hypothetical protein